jgi:PUA-domain protein
MAKMKKRHRIRRKEALRYAEQISGTFGCEALKKTDEIEIAEGDGHQFVLEDGVPVVIILDGAPILTVRGMMMYKPTRNFVEVDMGAVPFVTKGADVMAPGIVAADEAIAEGDLVWIRDQRNKRPLAIGRALLSGPEMVSSKKGKAVRTIHYVGDEIWQVEV